MRGAYDVADTIGSGIPRHIQGCLKVWRSVVDSVDQVCMDVDHSFPLSPVLKRALNALPELRSWRRRSSSHPRSRAVFRWIYPDEASCPGHFVSHSESRRYWPAIRWDSLRASLLRQELHSETQCDLRNQACAVLRACKSSFPPYGRWGSRGHRPWTTGW